MDLAKRRGQFEPVRITGDNLVNGIGAKLFVVEFFFRASCSDVLRAKPHLVANAVFWGFVPVSIVKLGHVVGCLDQCGLCLIGCLSHPGCEVVQGFKSGLTNGFKSESWVLTSVEHERGRLESKRGLGRYRQIRQLKSSHTSRLVFGSQRGKGIARLLG